MKEFIYGTRRLLRTPLATAAAIVSLALGIGVNVAIFSIYEALVLRPLPVPSPEALVFFRSHSSSFGVTRFISYPVFQELRTKADALSDVAVRAMRPMNLTVGGKVDRISGELVSGNYYKVLGTVPALGRLITEEDDRGPGAAPVVVLLYDYWQRRFGADPGILGSSILINSHPYTIIGVTARGFYGTEVGSELHVQVPVTMAGQILGGQDRLRQPRSSWLEAFGRRKPGVSLTAANAAISGLYTGIRSVIKVGPERLELIAGATGVSPLRTAYTRQLSVLLIVAGCVLLLTCLNVSNFVFARVFAGRRATAIRVSLGARRWALVWQPLAESILLCSTGAALGVVSAGVLGAYLLTFLPEGASLGRFLNLVDLRILGFSLFATSVSAGLVAAYPAYWSTFASTGGALRVWDLTSSHRGISRFFQSFLIMQIALSAILVSGAALFGRTLIALERNDTGFERHNLVLLSLDPARSGLSTNQSHEFYTNLLESMRKTPGVDSVGFARLAAFNGDTDSNTICAEGYRPGFDEKMEQSVNTVSPGYFTAAASPLESGRDFNHLDFDGNVPVAIISHKMALDLFAGRSPLGRKIGIGCDDSNRASIEVVGVVADARYEKPQGTALKNHVYSLCPKQ